MSAPEQDHKYCGILCILKINADKGLIMDELDRPVTEDFLNNYFIELQGLMDSADEHITKGDVIRALKELSENVDKGVLG